MTGFIKGLFKGNKDSGAAPQAPAPKSGDAFFLEPDDAKTFGDIDYMRQAKTVERTFPKGKRKAQVRQISSDTYRNLDNQTFSSGPSFTTTPPKQTFGASKPSFSSTTNSTSTSSTSAPKQETEKRRPAPDSGMDMFRNMAKSIRKG